MQATLNAAALARLCLVLSLPALQRATFGQSLAVVMG
jgi:hypothetical protein